jgi:hypothetical protein
MSDRKSGSGRRKKSAITSARISSDELRPAEVFVCGERVIHRWSDSDLIPILAPKI